MTQTIEIFSQATHRLKLDSVNLPMSAGLPKTEWDLKLFLLDKIRERGGFVNTHSHLDRAFTISPETLHFADATLQEKWDLVDQIKRDSSVSQIYDRMAQGVEAMISQGVHVMGSFIDVDAVIEDKAMVAAARVREKYQGQITIKFINQALKGVITPDAREWFDRGAEFVDIIGGLPGRDKGHEAEHLDVLFSTAKSMGKIVHVHVDQFNHPAERETELLVAKTREHAMQGRVVAIHGISVAAQSKEYRQALYAEMKQAGVSVISCPTAWIDSRRSETLAPTHNSIAPVEELMSAGIPVAIGTDNIADYYKPFTNGDMWTELRFLLESCHYYEVDSLVKIATTNGRKILGIE